MKIYMDNCCFNRPFDDQGSLVVQLETEAKLNVQERIKQGELDLCWSFILDYENRANPYEEVRYRINEWKYLASIDCDINDVITSKARSLMDLGLRHKDALHVACAIHTKADYFLTTDKKIINKQITGINV